MENVSVISDGVGLCATIQVVQVKVLIAQDTESATALPTSARVAKAGLVLDATYQIVQAIQTVSTEDSVIRHSTLLSAPTVLKVLWDLPVQILVNTACKFQWTVETAFVNQAGLE